jgi:hypothetical protein
MISFSLSSSENTYSFIFKFSSELSYLVDSKFTLKVTKERTGKQRILTCFKRSFIHIDSMFRLN